MGLFPASARDDNPTVCHSFQCRTGLTGREQQRLPASVSFSCEEQCPPRSPRSLPNPEQATLLLANPLTQAITLG